MSRPPFEPNPLDVQVPAKKTPPERFSQLKMTPMRGISDPQNEVLTKQNTDDTFLICFNEKNATVDLSHPWCRQKWRKKHECTARGFLGQGEGGPVGGQKKTLCTGIRIDKPPTTQPNDKEFHSKSDFS